MAEYRSSVIGGKQKKGAVETESLYETCVGANRSRLDTFIRSVIIRPKASGPWTSLRSFLNGGRRFTPSQSISVSAVSVETTLVRDVLGWVNSSLFWVPTTIDVI